MSEVVPSGRLRRTRPRRATSRPGLVALPRSEAGPVRAVLRRMAIATLVLAATVAVVYLDRDGYRDGDDLTGLTLLDTIYYATVSLSTTGYGDITPFTDQARLVNVLVVTPMRVLFLIILVGTTLEALTERSREQWRTDRWRQRLKDHTVVVGYGTKGRSAIRTLVSQQVPSTSIVVVDPTPEAIAEANREGLAGIVGDATRSEVLARAEVAKARRVIVAAQRDDTAVLVTLTARALNPRAVIVSSVRESENAPLLQQSGASTVITSSDAAGRLLGIASTNPSLGEVLEDLLIPGSGLQLSERVLRTSEVGASVKDLDEIVLAVVRNGKVKLYDDPDCNRLRQDDHVVVLEARGPHQTAEGEDPRR